MTSSFVVRPEAEADIEEAYAWYESRSMGLGDRFLAAVEGTLGLIREAPARFPVKHREPDFSIRRSLVDGFPYGVFFIWNEVAGATSVIACMHARRDPRRWLRRA
ncbi:MAG: type II toxin-antitoxin system RelE/ParE family toxin [Gemmatimonadaceae bacterium]